MTRALSVWWDQVVVSTLQINQHGEMRFTYAAGWLADAARPALVLVVVTALDSPSTTMPSSSSVEGRLTDGTDHD